MLYYSAAKLRLRLEVELAKDEKNADLVFEIEAALQVTKEDFAKDEENLQSLLKSGKITFETLWAIVPPNELIYTLDALSEPCVYRAARSAVCQMSDGTMSFYIHGRGVDSNGKKLGWTWSQAFEIPAFTGEKEITDLPAYPLRFHKDHVGVRQMLLERGRRRMQLHGQRFYEYSGLALHETKSPLGEKGKEKLSVSDSAA